jgi:hypothetical protein
VGLRIPPREQLTPRVDKLRRPHMPMSGFDISSAIS